MKTAAERLAAADAAVQQEPPRARISSGYRGPGQAYDRNCQRLDEHERFIVDLCDGPCTTDDADMHLRPMLPHLAALRGGFDTEDFQRATHRLCARLFPNLPAEVIDEIIDEGRAGDLRFLSADQYGKAIGLPSERRRALGIRRIGAADRTKAQRARDRKRANAAHQAEKRKSKGATPRTASKAAVARQLGISLATYKRRLAAGLLTHPPMSREPVSSAVGRSPPIRETEVAHGSSQPTPETGPASTGGASQSAGAGVHSHGTKTKRVVAGRAVPLAPSIKGIGIQDDFLDGPGMHARRALELMEREAWSGGPMPAEMRLAVRDAVRGLDLSHTEFANLVGLSRQAITNATRAAGIDGLGATAAANLKRLLQRQAGAG